MTNVRDRVYKAIDIASMDLDPKLDSYVGSPVLAAISDKRVRVKVLTDAVMSVVDELQAEAQDVFINTAEEASMYEAAMTDAERERDEARYERDCANEQVRLLKIDLQALVAELADMHREQFVAAKHHEYGPRLRGN